MEPLVSLVPSSVLVFNLEKGTQPRAILRISNTSNNRIVFKVKTTQPTWYYVRPNQQMLEVGQSEDVAILLVDTECNRFLEQSASNNEEKLDKHRFLVQSKVIDDAEYARLLELAPQLRSDEFTKIWEGPKDDRKNIKLKVEFKYPEVRSNPLTGINNRPSSVDVGEAVRSRLSGGATRAANSEAAPVVSSSSLSSPESIFSELQGLRKKYDAVVEYTVHLTAERDAIVAQLETSQRELVREKSRKKQAGVGDARDTQRDEAVAARKSTAEKGFSLFVVLFVALLCFLLGKYFL